MNAVCQGDQKSGLQDELTTYCLLSHPEREPGSGCGTYTPSTINPHSSCLPQQFRWLGLTPQSVLHNRKAKLVQRSLDSPLLPPQGIHFSQLCSSPGKWARQVGYNRCDPRAQLPGYMLKKTAFVLSETPPHCNHESSDSWRNTGVCPKHALLMTTN